MIQIDNVLLWWTIYIWNNKPVNIWAQFVVELAGKVKNGYCSRALFVELIKKLYQELYVEQANDSISDGEKYVSIILLL